MARVGTWRQPLLGANCAGPLKERFVDLVYQPVRNGSGDVRFKQQTEA